VNPAIKKLFGGVVLWQHWDVAGRIHDRVLRGRQSASGAGRGNAQLGFKANPVLFFVHFAFFCG
jgi:hypothetical protein